MGGPPVGSPPGRCPATCGRATLPAYPLRAGCPMVGEPMRRREFITLLGGAAAWPLAASAQPSGKTHRIGFLGVFSYSEYRRNVDALHRGLRQLGYEEGKN